MDLIYEKIKKDIKKTLKTKRYDHVLRVVDTALRLNFKLKLNLDEDKIKLATILHDSAKNNEELYFKKFKEKYNLNYDEVFKIPVLAHAILGEIIAIEEYKIKDIDILNSIRWHTTGRKNMTELEKLVFLADYIEPGRSFHTVDKTRKIAETNLDKAVLDALNNEIIYLINNNAIIAIEALEARNYLLRSVNE